MTKEIVWIPELDMICVCIDYKHIATINKLNGFVETEGGIWIDNIRLLGEWKRITIDTELFNTKYTKID